MISPPPSSSSVDALRTACLLLVVVATAACGSRQPPETAPPPPQPVAQPSEEVAARGDDVAPPTARVHTVQAGDTLWSLARRYGVSVDDFVAANRLADPDNLSVGERLVIPDNAVGSAWVWPVAGGAILSGFGARRGGDTHRGLDIDAEAGQPVVAAWPGVVVYAGSGMRDYGTAVIIDHGNGLTSLYGHNSELLVSTGDRVGRGQPIARAGRSGNATTVHCHFEVRRYAKALDPVPFFSGAAR